MRSICSAAQLSADTNQKLYIIWCNDKVCCCNFEDVIIRLKGIDYEKGWGVVLNEAMNSGCTVVASHAAGATPFLVRNNVNGMIYKNGKKVEFIDLLIQLVRDKGLQERLGRKAYRTIENNWNPRIAAENLYALSKAILNNDEYICKSGPM